MHVGPRRPSHPTRTAGSRATDSSRHASLSASRRSGSGWSNAATTNDAAAIAAVVCVDKLAVWGGVVGRPGLTAAPLAPTVSPENPTLHTPLAGALSSLPTPHA